MEVVPEVDVPSHVLSWERAYPDIVRARCGRSQKARKFPHCVANLDPTREETYTVLGAVLAGVRSAFPRNATSLVHLGGDEVDYKAWRGDELAQWLEDHPRAFPSPPLPAAIRPDASARRPTRVVFQTKRGRIVIMVYPQWAPLGARRFLDMVSAVSVSPANGGRGGGGGGGGGGSGGEVGDGDPPSYFTRMKLYRVMPDFLVQFGIPAVPSPDWDHLQVPIKDDPFR